MMKCKGCGASVKSNQRFCEYCGTELIADNQPEVRYVYQPPQPIVVNVVNTNTNTNTNGYPPRADTYPYKSRWTAFFLCLFLGYFGVHRFYVGKVGSGIVYILTGGFFFVGWALDTLLLLFGAFRDKYGHKLV